MMIYGVFRRRLCVMLACLMVVMMPISAYAQVYNVATMSDAEADAWIQEMLDTLEVEVPAETIVNFDNLPEHDPLSNLTEEQYAAYCQTFIDHPSVLLDYPEGVPQPRFAITLSAAAVYVLYLLAAAVGIVFTWNFTSWVQGYGGYDFFSGFEQYMRVTHAGVQDFWDGWDAVMNATWGKAVTGVKTIYKYLKEYCTARMEGYGTDVPSYSFTAPFAGSYISSDGTYEVLKGREYEFTSVTAPIYAYYFRASKSLRGYKGGYFFVSLGSFFESSSSANRFEKFYYEPIIAGGASDMSLFDDSSFFSYLGEFDLTQYKNESIIYLFQSIFDSDFVLGSDNIISITPEKSIVNVQEKTFTAPADTITLPADQTAADTLGSKVSAATDAATVTDALTGTWDLGETQAGEDTDDTVYPWVPDITGWLEKLLHGIEAIPGQATDALTGLGEKVEALPGSIAQTLENTLIGTDDGTYQISEVITNKFPFCVPFDLVGCFRVLQAPASPPVWRIPFTINNSFIHIHEELVIDLSDWERPAAVIRFFVLLMFIFGLAYVTRYVVKG